MHLILIITIIIEKETAIVQGQSFHHLRSRRGVRTHPYNNATYYYIIYFQKRNHIVLFLHFNAEQTINLLSNIISETIRVCMGDGRMWSKQFSYQFCATIKMHQTACRSVLQFNCYRDAKLPGQRILRFFSREFIWAGSYTCPISIY